MMHARQRRCRPCVVCHQRSLTPDQRDHRAALFLRTYVLELSPIDASDRRALALASCFAVPCLERNSLWVSLLRVRVVGDAGVIGATGHGTRQEYLGRVD